MTASTIELWLPSGSGRSNGVGPHGPPPSTRGAASGGGLATTAGGSLPRRLGSRRSGRRSARWSGVSGRPLPSSLVSIGVSDVVGLVLDLELDVPVAARTHSGAQLNPPPVHVAAVRLAVHVRLHPGLQGRDVVTLQDAHHVRGRGAERGPGRVPVARRVDGHRPQPAVGRAVGVHVRRRLAGPVAALLAVRRALVALRLQGGLERRLVVVELLARDLQRVVAVLAAGEPERVAVVAQPQLTPAELDVGVLLTAVDRRLHLRDLLAEGLAADRGERAVEGLPRGVRVLGVVRVDLHADHGAVRAELEDHLGVRRTGAPEAAAVAALRGVEQVRALVALRRERIGRGLRLAGRVTHVGRLAAGLVRRLITRLICRLTAGLDRGPGLVVTAQGAYAEEDQQAEHEHADHAAADDHQHLAVVVTAAARRLPGLLLPVARRLRLPAAPRLLAPRLLLVRVLRRQRRGLPPAPLRLLPRLLVSRLLARLLLVSPRLAGLLVRRLPAGLLVTCLPGLLPAALLPRLLPRVLPLLHRLAGLRAWRLTVLLTRLLPVLLGGLLPGVLARLTRLLSRLLSRLRARLPLVLAGLLPAAALTRLLPGVRAGLPAGLLPRVLVGLAVWLLPRVLTGLLLRLLPGVLVRLPRLPAVRVRTALVAGPLRTLWRRRHVALLHSRKFRSKPNSAHPAGLGRPRSRHGAIRHRPSIRHRVRSGVVSAPCQRRGGLGPVLEQDPETVRVQDRHAEGHCLVILRPRRLPDHHERGLLRHRTGHLAAAGLDRRGRLVPGEALDRPGHDERQPSQRLRHVRLGPLLPHLHTRGAPLVDDVAVPVDAEPVHDRGRDRRPDPFHARQLLGGSRLDTVQIVVRGGQGLRRGGPDVADRERHQDAGERLALGLLEVGQQPGRVRLQPAGLGGEERAADQVVLGEPEQVALVGDQLVVDQRVRRLEPEHLDVERRSARQVEQPLAQLCRAGARVRAADIGVALLLRPQLGIARRALGRHHERPLAAVAQVDHRAEDLRDDVPRLAQHDGVADQHTLADHLLRVVQGRELDRGPGNPDRLHDAVRSHPAGAADVHLDVEQPGVDLLRRVLERDRPARRPRRRAEHVLHRDVVDLDHHAVDLVHHG